MSTESTKVAQKFIAQSSNFEWTAPEINIHLALGECRSARERHGIFDRGIEGRTEIESRRSENRVHGRWTACIVHCEVLDVVQAPFQRPVPHLGRNSGLPLLACEDVGPETVCAHLKPPSQRAEPISARIWHGNPLRNLDDLSVGVGMLQMAPGNAPLDASI
ncbi:hypothetical protein DFH09DRAFT_1076663 [Mycena vulgaris]|nr:hypothetical protein DFH09DRAFT_1076663 [Mycena vulgaris]